MVLLEPFDPEAEATTEPASNTELAEAELEMREVSALAPDAFALQHVDWSSFDLGRTLRD